MLRHAVQLRDQSCWFFAPTGGITPNHIRDWMGDFSDIKVVGKRAARMGQCFSSTLDAAHVMVSGEAPPVWNARDQTLEHTAQSAAPCCLA